MTPHWFWTSLLVACPIAVIALFACILRIGKRRRAAQLQEGDRAPLETLWRALKAGDYRSASRKHFLAALADLWSPAMKALRVLLCALALLILLLLGYGAFSALQSAS